MYEYIEGLRVTRERKALTDTQRWAGDRGLIIIHEKYFFY
jgi:hypothetical protein